MARLVAGALTTFAGSGTQGDADGRGRLAAFGSPGALTFDAGGTLYLVDGQSFRRIAPDGGVSTPEVTGAPGRPFMSATGLAVDAAGVVYVADRDPDTNAGIFATISPASRRW